MDMGGTWYPRQFLQYCKEEELIKATFLHYSSSCSNAFVWPQMQINGKEDKSWIAEGMTLKWVEEFFCDLVVYLRSFNFSKTIYSMHTF